MPNPAPKQRRDRDAERCAQAQATQQRHAQAQEQAQERARATQEAREDARKGQGLRRAPSTSARVQPESLERTRHDLVLKRRLKLLEAYSQGRTPEQLASDFKLPQSRIERELKLGLDSLVHHFAAPSPQHAFVRYAVFQLRIVEQLRDTYDSMISDDETKQYNAAISALRAQSDIYDKIMEQGRTYGVIQQRPAAASLHQAPADLKQELMVEIRSLVNLVERVDPDTQFRQFRTRLRDRDGRLRSTKVARIRKVRRDPYGFVFAVKDWKLKPQVRAQLSSETTITRDPILTQLREEAVTLTATLTQQRSTKPQQPQTEVHGSVIDATASQLPTPAGYLVPPRRLPEP